MSFGSIGLDFMGGATAGAGAGASVSAGNPYVTAAFAVGGGLQRVLAGQADKPAERMNLRLGKQEIAMNDLDIATKERANRDAQMQKAKMRAVQDVLSKIFSNYGKAAA